MNHSNPGCGFYSKGGQFYYIRGLGLVKTTQDIGNVVVATNNGIPTFVRDVAKVEIGTVCPALVWITASTNMSFFSNPPGFSVTIRT